MNSRKMQALRLDIVSSRVLIVRLQSQRIKYSAITIQTGRTGKFQKKQS